METEQAAVAAAPEEESQPIDQDAPRTKSKDLPEKPAMPGPATEEIMRCTSCGKRIEAERHWVRFPCPSCGKKRIIRCERCKSMENRYTCTECKFVGP